MKPKYLIIIFFVALASVVGVIYYANLPAMDLGPITIRHKSPAPTSATSSSVDIGVWKTYVNNQYGFNFQYPENWQFRSGLVNASGNPPKVKVDGSWSFDPFVAVGNPLSGAQDYTLYVFISRNVKKLNALDYARDMITNAPTDGPGGLKYDRKFQLSVGGQQAYELYNVFDYDRGNEEIIFAAGSFIYKISFPIADDNSNLSEPKDNNATAHKILSTFKFIK
jgi:PsbP-like protein